MCFTEVGGHSKHSQVKVFARKRNHNQIKNTILKVDN